MALTRYLPTLLLLGAFSSHAADPVTTATGEEEARPRRKRVAKDLGELTMTLGDVEWKATSARARLKGTTLAISASRMDGDYETSMVRQSLQFQIEDYSGPGSYTLPQSVSAKSLFVVVGLDLDKADGPEMDQALRETLSKAKTLVLRGAKVTIESADEKQIIGSFACDQTDPIIRDGRFRAIVKAPRQPTD